MTFSIDIIIYYYNYNIGTIDKYVKLCTQCKAYQLC